MDKIMYFKPIPSCYDVSDDMVSKRPSKKDLRSNPKPPTLSPEQKENQTCAQNIKRFFKKVFISSNFLTISISNDN